MSRTIRGKKSPGYEFWSKRPTDFASDIGSYGKKRTRKTDRMAQKRELAERLSEHQQLKEQWE